MNEVVDWDIWLTPMWQVLNKEPEWGRKPEIIPLDRIPNQLFPEEEQDEDEVAYT